MLAVGGLALLGAGMLIRWIFGQGEPWSLLGVLLLLAGAAPLALFGVVFLGAGLRAMGDWGEARPAPGGGPARPDVLPSVGRALLLLGATGVVTWAVVFDRMGAAAWVIGMTLAALVLLGLIRSNRVESSSRARRA
jgi:hypothetical protein